MKQKECQQQIELTLEWPETEERIDIISSNGATGEHYNDVQYVEHYGEPKGYQGMVDFYQGLLDNHMDKINKIVESKSCPTHYLDIKKQMLSTATDREVIEWFRMLQDKLTLTMYRTYQGDYAVYLPSLDIVTVSETSYLDCLKQIIIAEGNRF